MMKTLNAIIESHMRERDQALKRRLVTRKLGESLASALNSSLVKVITGPRRCGKSTLALQVLAGRRFAYLNFEDDALFNQSVNSDELIDSLHKVYGESDILFFDEIQNFPNWESFVNKLHRRQYNIIITGSNSRLLSRELGSALTGRHLSFELLPFSYSEFLLGLATDKASNQENFQEFLNWGGFPEVVLGSTDPSAYLKTLFDSVVLRDIVTRHRIRAATGIHDLLTLLINSAASRFSARSVERSLGSLSTATIQKFIAYCREAYLIQDLQAYSFKAKLRLKADRKIYALDNGFISAVSQPASPNTARLLENLVFVELVRRGFKPNIELFYYQTSSGTEVDFLLRRGAKNLELIQVCRDIASFKTREREIRAISKAAEELNVDKLSIVTLETEELVEERGIRIHVIPCWKWLTQTSP